MKRLVSLAAIMVALSGPAFAFTATLGTGTTSASTSGGAGSVSGVAGGSAIVGITHADAANVSTTVGGVQATNKTTPAQNQSTVTQSFGASNVSTMNSGSLGLAGSFGFAGGVAGSSGKGAANGSYLSLSF